MVRLSIIIPIYNGAAHLRKLIQTIEAFTFLDFECIFVDNNSTDGSMILMNKLLGEVKFKYTILTEKKQGAGHARNWGIKHANGEFLAFLDCDDIILPRKFEKDMDILSNNDIDFVFCRTSRIYDNGYTIKHPNDGIKEGENDPPSLGYVWLKSYFKLPGTGSLVVRKEIINHLGGFNTSLTGEDAFLFIKLGLFHKGFFYNEINFHYLRHRQSTITKSNKKESGGGIRYLELRKNLYSDSQIAKDETALAFLEKQITIDLYKLNFIGEEIQIHLKDPRLKNFKPSSLLFNPVNSIINILVPKVKYNPIYQYYIRFM